MGVISTSSKPGSNGHYLKRSVLAYPLEAMTLSGRAATRLEGRETCRLGSSMGPRLFRASPSFPLDPNNMFEPDETMSVCGYRRRNTGRHESRLTPVAGQQLSSCANRCSYTAIRWLPAVCRLQETMQTRNKQCTCCEHESGFHWKVIVAPAKSATRACLALLGSETPCTRVAPQPGCTCQTMALTKLLTSALRPC
jgi:hypothetical protein